MRYYWKKTKNFAGDDVWLVVDRDCDLAICAERSESDAKLVVDRVNLSPGKKLKKGDQNVS